MKDISIRDARMLLLVVIFIAAILRLWGIWHGYPYSYYPDEAHFVKRALSFGSGDLNPHWFHKPAFYMYILFFEYGVLFVAGKIAGLWKTLDQFGMFYIINPGPFYILGRVTTTLFSVGSVLITYLAAARLFNRKTGLLAALALALTFGHVVVAKDVKADTPCMFFTILSAYFLVQYLLTVRNGYVYAAALAAGAGAATKYYSLLMIIPILTAILFRMKKEAFDGKVLALLRTAALSVIALYGAYFICSPYNFIDPLGRKFSFHMITSMTTSARSILSTGKTAETHRGASTGSARAEEITLAGNSNSEPVDLQDFEFKRSPRPYVPLVERFSHYAGILREGLGDVFLLLCSAGMVLTMAGRAPGVITFLMFPLLMTVIAATIHSVSVDIRHQIVTYPFLAVCAGYAVSRATEAWKRRSLIAVLVALVFIPPAVRIVKYDMMISTEDTRNIAKKWIEENIPSGSRILLEDGQLKLSPNENYYREIISRARAIGETQFTYHAERYYSLCLRALPPVTYDLTYMRLPWWRRKDEHRGVYYARSEFDLDMGNPLKPVGVMPLEYYKRNGCHYVITCSNFHSKFLEDTDLSRSFPAFAEFYRTLFEQEDPIKEIGPENTGGHGPVIRIFQIS